MSFAITFNRLSAIALDFTTDPPTIVNPAVKPTTIQLLAIGDLETIMSLGAQRFDHLGAAADAEANALAAVGSESAARTNADVVLNTAISNHAALTTAAHGGIVGDGDARLTNARTPTAHAASHGEAGSDPLDISSVGSDIFLANNYF